MRDGYPLCYVVLSGRNFETVVSRAKCMLKLYNAPWKVEMTQVCILNYYVFRPYHLGFGSLEGARRSMGETVWEFGGGCSCYEINRSLWI